MCVSVEQGAPLPVAGLIISWIVKSEITRSVSKTKRVFAVGTVLLFSIRCNRQK